MGLYVTPPSLHDGDLAILEFFPEIESLTLDRMALTDRALRHLRGTRDLKYLYLGASNNAPKDTMTGDGLRYLAGMTKLITLRLENTRIADPG